MFRLSQISTIGAFRYQLTPDGVLVAPLGIKGLTRSVALTRDESGVWRGHSAVNCGFMPIRGHGAVPERNIHVAEDLTVRFDDGQDVDVEALTQAIASPGEVVWTGVLIDRPLDLLDFYLAELEGFCRILAPPSIAERGLIEPANGWGSMGVAAGQALGYLTKRTSPDNPHLYELGVCAYGPGAAAMLHDLVERVDWWGRTRDSIAGVRIEVYPSGQGEVLDALMTVDKRHSRVVVRPEPEPGPKEPLASSDLDTEGQVRHAGVHRCVLEGKLAGVADPHGSSFGIPAGDLNRARVDVDALCLPTQLHRLVEDGTRATVGIEQGFARLAGQPYHRRCDGGPERTPPLRASAVMLAHPDVRCPESRDDLSRLVLDHPHLDVCGIGEAPLRLLALHRRRDLTPKVGPQERPFLHHSRYHAEGDARPYRPDHPGTSLQSPIRALWAPQAVGDPLRAIPLRAQRPPHLDAHVLGQSHGEHATQGGRLRGEGDNIGSAVETGVLHLHTGYGSQLIGDL